MKFKKSRWKFTGPYLARYKKWLIAGLLLVIVQKAVDQVLPWMVKAIIDNLAAGSGLKSLGAPLLVMGIATVVSAVIMYFQRYLVSVTSRRIEFEMRNDLYTDFQAQPKKFTDENPIGELMSNATNDLDRIRDFLGPVLLHLTGMISLLIFTLISMYMLSPKLVLLGMFPVLTLPLLVNRFLKKMHQLYKKIQEQLSSLNSFVQDTISGIQVVKAYGAENTFQEKFTHSSGDLKDTSIRVNLLTSAMWPLIAVFSSLGMLLVIWQGSLMVMREQITLGVLSAALLYLLKLQFPLAGLGWVANLMQRSNASIDRIVELKQKCAANTKPAHSPAGIYISAASLLQPASIKLKNLSFSYTKSTPDEDDILKNINLVIPSGSTLGIVGPTGSGKTTLINLICNVYSPPPGTLYYGDHPVEDYGDKNWKSLFSLAPQDGFLFSTTIRENIGLGSSKSSRLKFDEAGHFSGITPDLGQIAGGYEALLGERGINLSGGQKQRVGLARSLMKDARVLCLDDTLSALDTETESAVLKNLKEQSEDKTVIIISHRYSSISHCDNIIYLEKGTLKEQGTHNKLMELGGQYAMVFKKQAISEDWALT